MAKDQEAKIKKRLTKLTKQAIENGEEVTTNSIRLRTEEALGLEEGFLKSEAWRQKSKAIITAAYGESDLVSSQPGAQDTSEDHPGEATQETATKENEENGASESEDEATSSKEGDQEEASTTPPAVNGRKRKQDDTASGEESAEDSDGEEENDAEGPQHKRAKTDSPSPASRKNQHSSHDASKEPIEYLGPIPAIPFNPPAGYNQLDRKHLSTNSAFSQANLSRKQIWHITAPANLPLTSLTQISQEALKSRAPILTHNGTDYTLSEATEKENHTSESSNNFLLVANGEGYERSFHTIQRTLRIQQKISLPDLSARQASQVTGSNAAADVGRAAVSSIRPQPKGLRMRYRPPGFGAGRLGNVGSESMSSEDEDDEGSSRPTFQFPKTLGAHGKAPQQYADVEMLDASAEASQQSEAKSAKKREKKKKKDKVSQLSQDASAASHVNGTSQSSTLLNSSPPVIHNTQEEFSDSALPNGVPSQAESKAEKARRKEEKRAAKAAKAERKAKASSME